MEEKEFLEICKKQDELIIQMNQIFGRINSIFDAVTNKSNKYQKMTMPQLEDKHMEKGYYKDFPVSEEDNPLFKEEFIALTKNLDEESIRQVSQIIYRLQWLKASKDNNLPPFTKEEMKKINFVNEHFEKEIIRLSKNCFFYNGYLLPNSRFEACVFVDKCGLNNIDHPEKFKDKDIIDAGAYIGDSALILSKITARKVYAFEPTAENYRDMLKTIEMNNLENVVPCKYALGKEKGTVKMTNAIVSSANSFEEHSAMPYLNTETVDVITLDDFVEENNLHVGLIKTDVEGAEQLLLSGAMKTICSQKPTLLISIYHNASDFYSIKPMLENLGLGYKFKIRHPAIGTVLMETMLIAETE